MTPLLEGRGLTLPGRVEPTDVDFHVGERVALIGPNGGGKTSLLRAIAGAEDAAGTVVVDGSPLPAAGPRRWRLLSFMRASRDIGWAIPVRDLIRMGAPVPEQGRMNQLVKDFELGTLLDRPVTALSTGERARVLMARVLAAEARVMLLDEPLSNLDPYWVLKFLEQFDRRAAAGSAIVCALHDLSLIDRFDRALLLVGGRIISEGTPAEVRDSEAFRRSFRIEPAVTGGWSIRRPEDPRSSP